MRALRRVGAIAIMLVAATTVRAVGVASATIPDVVTQNQCFVGGGVPIRVHRLVRRAM